MPKVIAGFDYYCCLQRREKCWEGSETVSPISNINPAAERHSRRTIAGIGSYNFKEEAGEVELVLDVKSAVEFNTRAETTVEASGL